MAGIKAILISSTILTSSLTTVAATPVPGSTKDGKPWKFLWNTPPPSDYVVTKYLSCAAGGKAWPSDNERAEPITKLVIHSSPGVINGVTVTYKGTQALTHGEAHGTLADQVLNLSEDKWVSLVKAGCTGGKLSYLAFGDGKKTIEAGKSASIQSWNYDWSAAFQFSGTVQGGALASLGVNFSEVENPDEDDFSEISEIN